MRASAGKVSVLAMETRRGKLRVSPARRSAGMGSSGLSPVADLKSRIDFEDMQPKLRI
jgi:hypothetical protein